MKQALYNVGEEVAKLIREELKDQKHILTGEIENIDIEVNEAPDGWVIKFSMPFYARFLDQGVPAERIPYSPPTGRGGTSAYIEGLRRFAELRGMSNPLSAAFAIAATQKVEGMPTVGSRKLAERRTGFIDYVFNIHGQKVKDMVTEAVQAFVEVNLANMFTKHGAKVI